MKSGHVPEQWKRSIITPVAKIKNPSRTSDYRPISVTSILSRKLEHYIVEMYLYPAMLSPPAELIFEDQYAFKPTGSTTAALIALISFVTEMLREGKSVVWLSLDFSKAFDRVRHNTLFTKFERLDMERDVYNWILSYFDNRQHTTKFQGVVSGTRIINASVVQGSGLGPASFAVAASDLKPKSKSFKMLKYADDIDLLTSTEHYEEIAEEVKHIELWAATNNLTLNRDKTKELIFTAGRAKNQPAITEGIERVTCMKKLGVTLQSKLSMKDHVDELLTDCTNLLYAMNVLRSHGMNDEGLQKVFNSKVVSKLTYASSAWSGMANRDECGRINSFLLRSKRFGYYPKEGLSFEQLCVEADERLFKKILDNSDHVLFKFLPTKKQTKYDMRKRNHDFILPIKDDRNFFNRVLFRDIVSKK